METNHHLDLSNTPLPPRRNSKKPKKKKKTLKRNLIRMLTLLIFTGFLYPIYSYQKSLTASTPTEIYYSTDFDTVNDEWILTDANWLSDYQEQKGIMKLSRQNYFSPNMMTEFSTDQSPPETFVFKVTTRVRSFTESAITIATIYFPTGPLSIVVNNNFELGISNDFNAKPTYSDNATIDQDKWEDIYVFVDGTSNEASVYLNDEKIMTQPWLGETFPLQEVWLGSIWVGGGGGYGVTTDVAFDNLVIGNEYLLPQQSFTDHVIGLISGFVFGD
ncbi:hypothetical protein V1502_01745 [Bacillus sp. SCS-153A]|uniref:hypothetical protein n=1 Tax=Rossellomorea sedimentorum TaxID=3115294 RepID=UPI003905F0C9